MCAAQHRSARGWCETSKQTCGESLDGLQIYSPVAPAVGARLSRPSSWRQKSVTCACGDQTCNPVDRAANGLGLGWKVRLGYGLGFLVYFGLDWVGYWIEFGNWVVLGRVLRLDCATPSSELASRNPPAKAYQNGVSTVSGR